MRNYELDLDGFGFVEIAKAADIMNHLADKGYNALPANFSSDKLKIGFNPNSGFVFLTNDEYQCCFLRNEKLETWYSCHNCGEEGFEDDLEEHGRDCCKEYLRDCGEVEPVGRG